MSDVTTPAAGEQPTGSAGRLLQAARERRGLELDALAQLLKVPVRKLQALEADQFSELPGAAFTRSLAQSYARQVGLNVPEVLALLPQAVVPPQQLERVSRGLQTPYREGGGAHFGRGGFEGFKPVHGIALALLVLALLLWLLPPMGTILSSLGLSSADSAETTAEATTGSVVEEAVVSADGASGPPVRIETVHASPGGMVPMTEVVASAVPAAASAAVAVTAPPVAPATPEVAGTVVLRSVMSSWVEVRDAGNAVLLSRTMQTGETVGLDGAMPMRVRIGVASALEVSLRGEPVDLKPYTRGTTATVVLK